MHPLYKRTRRKTLLIGSFAIVIGLFGALIPILPGTLLVLLGLSILSLQSKLALRLLVTVRTRYPKIASSIKRAETRLVHFFNLTTHGREHVSILNKNGKEISILAEPTEFIAGTAVLLHSASGIAETRLMDTIAEAFKIRGFSLVRFDASNALGDLEGDYSKFTTTSYKGDLEAVIEWVGMQSWWQEPLVLVGHSLGGLVAGLYASEHQAEVDELILFAPTLSGTSYENALSIHETEMLEMWRSTGTRKVKHPISDEEFSLPYTFVEDMKKYSLEDQSNNLSMPITIYSGTLDTVSPVSDLEAFCNTIGKHATLQKLSDVRHILNSRKENEHIAQKLTKMHLQSKTSNKI